MLATQATLRSARFQALLERYGVKECCYGHLHGSSHRLAIEGEHHGVTYRLCAADYTNFAPIRLR